MGYIAQHAKKESARWSNMYVNGCMFLFLWVLISCKNYFKAIFSVSGRMIAKTKSSSQALQNYRKNN